VTVVLPKLGANTNVSTPLVPMPGVDANTAWIVAPACVPSLMEAPVTV